MPEMDDDFAEMISTLEHARRVVQADLDEELEGPALTQLDAAIRTFAEQADSVLVMMIAQDWSENLMDRAEALVDFFQGAIEQRASRLFPSIREAERGPSAPSKLMEHGG